MAIVRGADPSSSRRPPSRSGPAAVPRARASPVAADQRRRILAAAMIVAAAAAPLLAPEPTAQTAGAVLKGPGVVEGHCLGTDEFGRDLLSRIIWGARVSLQVGLASVAIAFAVGVPLGMWPGTRGAGSRPSSCGADMLMAFPPCSSRSSS